VSPPEVAPGVGNAGSFSVSATHGRTDLSDREGAQQSGRPDPRTRQPDALSAAAIVSCTSDATLNVQHFSLGRHG